MKFFKVGETDIEHSKENTEGHVHTIKLELKDFSWAMHHLLPPEDKQWIAGCEVRFPETAFFDSEPGKAKDILKTDISGCLVQVTTPYKLST